MLLFKPPHVPLILAGIKTDTRRLWIDKKTGKARNKPRCKVGAIHLAKTQMLSKEYFAKLLILKTWKEKLGDITDDDALKEGYNNREEYLLAFFEINKIKDILMRLDSLDQMIWVVRFKVIEKGGISK